ncbi:MAG: hypothetical protein KKA51_01150 [Nanoarchaeota archaeon]|nr:hypothetical protein [Nanoarchaeota archaeon]MBU1269183.1 hypothetical protein [Nanoarchaeota archaeon]
MMDECESILRVLTKKKHVIFTKRCNESILACLKLAKHLGYKDVHIPDQGGWITYSQYVKKLGLISHSVKTKSGLFEKFSTDSVLLMHSMPAYVALQDMKKLKAGLLINDVCGSIGTKNAKIGDLIVCSFGRWKPINFGSGGIIATDSKGFYDFLKSFESELDFEGLHKKLLQLRERLDFLNKKVSVVKTDLSDFDIIHKNENGLNVIVRFSSVFEKEKLIKYCQQNNYEFVECPRYIRVLDDAISVEIKRLDQ